MEKLLGTTTTKGDDHDQIELPPGFRFHPTDEELITHYLSKKVLDCNFSAEAIGEVDLNKCEPWDLPWRAKMGEKQWYFFCYRERKYPTGLRTNRATEAGYWKATGKDKEIYRGRSLIGMKKTLVFYRGRAPKGEKTSWIMHEYRLEGNNSLSNLNKTAKNEWVISRVFEKKDSSGGKKGYGSSPTKFNSFDNELGSSLLPPLMDSLPIKSEKPTYVNCFSNASLGVETYNGKMGNGFNSSISSTYANPYDISNASLISSKTQHLPNSQYFNQGYPNLENFQYPSSIPNQDQPIMRNFIENNVSNMNCKTEREMVSFSQETDLTTDINPEISSVVSNYEMGNSQTYEEQEVPSTSSGPVDLDCLWDF